MGYNATTTNHGLPQWSGDNKPTREDFNDAFSGIDAALFGHDADIAALNGNLEGINTQLSETMSQTDIETALAGKASQEDFTEALQNKME